MSKICRSFFLSEKSDVPKEEGKKITWTSAQRQAMSGNSRCWPTVCRKDRQIGPPLNLCQTLNVYQDGGRWRAMAAFSRRYLVEDIATSATVDLLALLRVRT